MKVCDPTVTRKLFELELSRFHSVMVLVAYHPLVVLPGHLKSDDWIAGSKLIPIEYGLDMPLPINDLKVTDNGVSATLSFSRVPFETYVPWKAMVGIRGLGVRPQEKVKPKLTLVP